MKKMLTGILILGSAYAYAQDSFVITNRTSPEEQISVRCDDQDCRSITTTFLRNGALIREERIDSEILKQKAEAKIRVKFDCKENVATDEFDTGWDRHLHGVVEFGFTRSFTDGAKERWDRGYEVGSILQYTFLGPLGLALDVAATPFTLPLLGFKCIQVGRPVDADYGKEEIKEARKALKTIEKGIKKGDFQLKERRFYKVHSYLFET